MDKEKLQSELNEINFYKCPGIKVGEVLHYVFPEKIGFKQVIKAFIRYAYYSFFSFCEFRQVGCPKTLTLFSNSYRPRADHKKAFDNVAGLIDNQLIVTPSKRKLNLTHLKDLFLPLVWVCQMRRTSATLRETIILSSLQLLRAYYDYCDVERYIRKNMLEIKYLVTYCDVLPVDSFFVQKFKVNGVTTVTLQHGTFNVTINPWTYTASKSDYFLAESPASVDLAHSVGYNKDIIPVGSPHHIQIEDCVAPETFPTVKTIGVFMNGDIDQYNLRNENIKMLQTALAYCKESHKNLLIKFHPTTKDITHYMPYIDLSITKLHWEDITVDEFGKLSDIVIVSASTVFTTMLKHWIPTFLFASKENDPEAFPKTDFIKFSTPEQLAKLVDGMNNAQFKKELTECRSYIVCDGCCKDNYKNAFKEIGIDVLD